jgi:hypothetical protein
MFNHSGAGRIKNSIFVFHRWFSIYLIKYMNEFINL